MLALRWGNPTVGALYRQFNYDDSGRLLEKQDGAGNPLYAVSYNGKGRAKQIIAGTQTGTFAYDANDYRVSKWRTGDLWASVYLREGKHVDATYAVYAPYGAYNFNSSHLTTKYLRGVVVDEIVNGYTYYSRAANDWANFTFHHDHLNSVTALTGHAGTVEDTTQYDAFGVPTSQIVNTQGTNNDLLFTGREYDRDTGLYYYRARYYDPQIGRFISEDPLGFKAGMNFYAYVGNNPINRNDPTGNCPSCVGALIGGGGELAAQFAESLITGSDFSPDFGRIGVAALAGATGVGIGNLANRLGRVASLAVNGVSEIGLNVGQEVINTGSFDAINNLTAKQAFLLGVTGVGSGVAGNFAADRFLSSSAVKLDLRQADRFTRIAQNRIDNGLPRPSRAQARFDKAFDITSSVDQAASIRSTITGGLVGSTSGTASRLFNADTQTSASGGFVLYPSKPNMNTLQAVYSK